MPKKYFNKFLPTNDAVRNNRWLRPFGQRLQHPALWHLHRRTVAGGVAVGMFCGLVPGPFQMLSAALLAVFFRVNLPVSMILTVYTNPFTIVPLYWLAFQLGLLVTGKAGSGAMESFTVPDVNWDNWFSVMMDWIAYMGKPFAIGLPLLATLLALAGYIVARVGWRLWVIRQWKTRKQRYSK